MCESPNKAITGSDDEIVCPPGSYLQVATLPAPVPRKGGAGSWLGTSPSSQHYNMVSVSSLPHLHTIDH